MHATSDVPRIDRKCETTKLSRSSQSQSNKRLSTWRSVTPPISSAGNRDIAFAAEKLCAHKVFALDSDGRCSIHRSRRKKAFFLTQAAPRGREQVSLFVRGFASNFSCSGNQESWENAETNRRLGMAITPAMGIWVILVSPSEDSFEKGNQSLDFPHFSTFVHTL